MNYFKRKRTKKQNKKNKTKKYRGGGSEDDFAKRDELLKTFQNKGFLVNQLLQKYTVALELDRFLREDPEFIDTTETQANMVNISNIKSQIDAISGEIEKLSVEIKNFDTIVRDKYRVLVQRAREKKTGMTKAAENQNGTGQK